MSLDQTYLIRLTKEQKSFLQTLPNASKVLRLYIDLLKQNEKEYQKWTQF